MTTTARQEHVHPALAMLYPAYTRRCEHCGGYVATTPEETLSRWTQAAYAPLARLARALSEPTTTSTLGLPTQAPQPGQYPDWGAYLYKHHHRGHHHHGYGERHHECGCGCDDDCRCRECGRDDCHCRCCVIDADLVVNTRLGERRIVPITIENNRRRERQIKLELSSFTSKGQSPSGVTGELLSPAEFTLDPCQERQAIIGIDTSGAQSKKQDEEKGDELRDVDDCRVAYADLRIVGCDHRPIRIAVSLLPRDCYSYPVDCACGCC
jgi:hypothetical protein